MSLRLDLLAGADADFQEAFSRFEELREGLGKEFSEAMDGYLARMADFPEIAPIYLGTIRRQVMRRFPYGIFYEPQPTRIVVLAVLDLRQDEQKIRKRLQ